MRSSALLTLTIAQKLRPFFPPLEPLQSVNLRAALFRALTELKKNGDLGRETTLRKTMLDDCKGEKFDELLAVFSTAVLRKLLAVSVPDSQWSTAVKLSTATSISPVDYQNMLPLILAHQVSLGATGARGARVHEAHEQFSQLLDDKKVELSVRAKKNATQEMGQTPANSDNLVREIRTNWLGSEEWATVLVDGGAQSRTDSFLELPFSKALTLATESSVNGLKSSAKQDLVVDLETRVLRLRSRLRKWNEFNETLRKERDASGSAAGTASREPQVLFRDHQPLTVASLSKAVRQPSDRGRALKQADRSFMSTINEAITRINGKAQDTSSRGVSTSPRKFNSPKKEYIRTVSPELPEVEAPISAEPEPVDRIPESEVALPSPPIVRLSTEHAPDEEDEAEMEPVKKPSGHTLVERTRKSMSLIPPLPHEAPPNPRRRGPRPSFAVNQFETPRKASGQNARSGASTPQDKLFEEDAEYNSVFKSRPRVAHSPISSPAVHFSPSFEEDESFELDQSGADWGDVDSPLATSRYR